MIGELEDIIYDSSIALLLVSNACREGDTVWAWSIEGILI
jgi:hypothetical protein